MKVSEAMTAQVATATPQTTIAEVARTMAQIESGAVPVMEDGKVVGLITSSASSPRATPLTARFPKS